MAARFLDPELSVEEEYLVDARGADWEQILFRRWKKEEQGVYFAQEFAETPETAFLAVGGARFNTEYLSEMIYMTKEPLIEEDGVSIWHAPQAGIPYAAAIDIASGKQSDPIHNRPTDFCAMTIWDMRRLVMVAKLHGRWESKDFAERCIDLASKYNDAFLVPERNLAQYGFMEYLMSVLGYTNVYLHNDDGHYGFPMSVKTKPMIESSFATLLSEQGSFICEDRTTVQELRNFRYLPNHKTGAPSGSHDDLADTVLILLSDLVRGQVPSLAEGRTLAGGRSRVESY